MSKFRSSLLIALTISMVSAPAFARTEGKVNGTFYLRNSGCSAAKPGDCPITFELRGAAAKALYRNMKSKVVKDTCTEGIAKTDASGMQCYKLPKGQYYCNFGYSFKAGRMSTSDVTC